MIFFDAGQSSQTRSHDHADLFGVLGSDSQPGVAQGLLRGRNGIMNKEIHFLDLFLIDVQLWVEVSHLPCNPRLKSGWVEPRERTDA